MQFSTSNPMTGEKLENFQYFAENQIEETLSQAFDTWKSQKTPGVAERSLDLAGIAKELRKAAPDLGLQMTLEMGKPLQDSLAEIEKSALTFEHFSKELEKMRAPQSISTTYQESLIIKDSLGPLLAVMPWNFPLWQITRLAAPAVGIGNPICLKHSELTAGSARKIQEIFDRVRPGLLINMVINHDQAARVIRDPRIHGVSLTGSARAGRVIGTIAAESLKKSVLELGGSDAYIVTSDADPIQAGEICARARMVNNGQSCVAAKRFIVDQKVKAVFMESFQAEIAKAKRGDPRLKDTQIGTLAHKKFQVQLLDQCQNLEKEGARKTLDLSESQVDFGMDQGAFFPARVYEVSKDSKLMKSEELFGPVALVIESRGDEEALEIANSSVYGLGGAIFSKDLPRAKAMARQMECGFVAINEQVKSDARLPFGGMKDSGYGRELSSFGFDEFCNIKSVGVSS